MTDSSWKLSAAGPKPVIHAALLAHEEHEDWDFDLAISGREIDEEHPQDWVLEAWYPNKPGKAQKDAISALFAEGGPDLIIEELADQDWLTLSLSLIHI